MIEKKREFLATFFSENFFIRHFDMIESRNNSQIWPALPANFLALRVWEEYSGRMTKFGRNDNNTEGIKEVHVQ